MHGSRIRAIRLEKIKKPIKSTTYKMKIIQDDEVIDITAIITKQFNKAVKTKT